MVLNPKSPRNRSDFDGLARLGTLGRIRISLTAISGGGLQLVPTIADLGQRLIRLDGRPYGAYRDLEGTYLIAPGLTVAIVHVQPDPFAPPSRLRITARGPWCDLPAHFGSTPLRRVATADILLRELGARLARESQGALFIQHPGPEMRERSAVQVTQTRQGELELTLRVRMALPQAHGRRVDGRRAQRLLGEVLPLALERTLRAPGRNDARIVEAIAAIERYAHIADALWEHGLVAFVADGSILPRASGTSQAPLSAAQALPFVSPPERRVRLVLDHGEAVEGMGLPRGVTVLVGGGYHGKSTLLEALSRAIHPHVPGDGRERVVTLADAVLVRAEDGRSVAGVDISPFVENLPDGQDARAFTTAKASGSTSQAAAVMEALEAGTHLLLLDEDTSAANFLARDSRMQALVPREEEPIRPFLSRVRFLAARGISTVLVAGSSGAAFEVADTVVQLLRYEPKDVTERARAIGGHRPSFAAEEDPFQALTPRSIRTRSLQEFAADKGIRLRGQDTLELTRDRQVEAGRLPQVFEVGELHAIAAALRGLEAVRQDIPARELSTFLRTRFEQSGLEALAGEGWERTLPRVHEVMAVLSRMPGLAVSAGAQGETWQPGGERP